MSKFIYYIGELALGILALFLWIKAIQIIENQDKTNPNNNSVPQKVLLRRILAFLTWIVTFAFLVYLFPDTKLGQDFLLLLYSAAIASFIYLPLSLMLGLRKTVSSDKENIDNNKETK